MHLASFRLKKQIDPFEKKIKDRIKRKIIWFFLTFGFLIIFLLLLLMMINFYVIEQNGKKAEYTDPLVIMWLIASLLFTVSIIFYSDDNLDRKNFLKLLKSIGIVDIKKKRNTFYCRLNGERILMSGYVESKYLTYVIKPFVETKTFSPASFIYAEYMNSTSQVNLFYPVVSDCYIDLKIVKNVSNYKIIPTECPDINQILATNLEQLDYCHWRLIFNEKWLQLKIIGGAWQGELFAQNIISGIDLFQQLVSAIGRKYPERDLSFNDIE